MADKRNEETINEEIIDEETIIERAPRVGDERAATARTSDKWVPASALPVPAMPPGWVARWIRTSTLGHTDNTNVSQKMREGWVPVRAEDHPELQLISDVGSRFKGNLEVGGLLLCKAPKELMDRRSEYHERKAKQQMDSVDNSYMKENDPRMPMLQPERKTRTEFGRG